jgi:hypothetical protein
MITKREFLSTAAIIAVSTFANPFAWAQSYPT